MGSRLFSCFFIIGFGMGGVGCLVYTQEFE